MIAIESFKRFKIIDIIAIIILAGLWLLLSFLLDRFLDPQASYILSLLIAVTLMSFTVHLVRKAGSATLFYALGALFTYSINDLGTIGSDKLIVLIIAGIIFELIFLIFKLEVKNIQLDIMAGTAISAASIPITTGLLLSFNVSLSMISSIINLILLSFFVGLIGAVFSFLIWYNLRATKIVLKYEYLP